MWQAQGEGGGELLEVFKKGGEMVRTVLRSESLSSALCSQVSLSLSKGTQMWKHSKDSLFVSASYSACLSPLPQPLEGLLKDLGRKLGCMTCVFKSL